MSVVLAYDTETTGTHDSAEIAQLGMILYASDRRVLGEFKSLIKPDGWVMPENTQAFHTKNGSTVSQENCERFGLSLPAILALFKNWASKADVLLAFNQKYDLARIKYSASRISFDLGAVLELVKVPCAMEMSTPILKIPPTPKMIEWGRGDQFKNPSLKEAYEFFFKREFAGAHDALADVRAAAEIYFHILDMEKKNGVL